MADHFRRVFQGARYQKVMNQIPTECPDRHFLKQFLLGQLSITEIEDCQEHLSECEPCVETVQGLKVSDTFTDVTRQALQASVNPCVSDDELISKMITDAEGWSADAVGTCPIDESAVSMDKAAEVQRLLREPIEQGDLGTIGHFRLLELIGAGSTGIVYLAVDTKLERDVVLKILRPSLGEAARKRFVAEAKATAAISHPNVVTIYEVGSDGPLSFIAMQWIPGQTLEQKLTALESLSVKETRKLAEEIAHGLAAAHDKGLIHRDIKPANVWIPSCDKPAKILDFGLVRVNDEDPQLTCTGMIAGTPCFMSPEQSRGDKLDTRSDLFSLGCVMYQSLTGKLPFRSDNALATLRSVQQDQPSAPNELDPTIDHDTSDLVMCLLEKSPARRPASAPVVIQALSTESHAWPFEIIPRSEPKPRLRPQPSWWKSIAALIIGIALTAFAFGYGQQIIRIATNQGEIVIDTKVDDVKIEIVGEGDDVKVIDLATRQSIEIKAGQYEIRPMNNDNSISIDRNVLTLHRGKTEIVKITRNESTSLANRNTGIDPRLTENFEIDPVSKLALIEPTITSLMVQLAEARQRFGPDHPQIRSLENKLSIYQQMLDANSESETPITRTYALKNIDADSASVLLSNLLGLSDAINPNVRIESVPHTNSLLAAGDEETLELIGNLILQVDNVPENDPTLPYALDSGDVLGIFIDGILGGFNEQPPIHQPVAGSEPAIGYPIRIEHDGTINLPFAGNVLLRGQTLAEARQTLHEKFKTGDKPVLTKQARIFVSLIRPRRFASVYDSTAPNPQKLSANEWPRLPEDVTSGTVPMPLPPANTEADNTPAEGSELQGKYLLLLDEMQLNLLKQNGQLKSVLPEQDRHLIDHVVLTRSEQNDSSAFPLPVSAVKNANGTLEFKIDDAMIENMNFQAFQLVLAKSDRGKVKEVVVVYEQPDPKSKFIELQELSNAADDTELRLLRVKHENNSPDERRELYNRLAEIYDRIVTEAEDLRRKTDVESDRFYLKQVFTEALDKRSEYKKLADAIKIQKE